MELIVRSFQFLRRAALSRNWYSLALCIWAQGCYTEYDICLLTFTYVKIVHQIGQSEAIFRQHCTFLAMVRSFIPIGGDRILFCGASLRIFFACRYHAGGMGLDRLLQCLFATLILRSGQYFYWDVQRLLGLA